MRKVAAVITNYNMPERADALASHIKKRSLWPVDVYLVDNGSDLQPPAKHTNVFLRANCQTTGGWLSGLEEADRNGGYFAYWFLITSAEFVDEFDPLTPMAEFMLDNPDVAGVHTSLTQDSTTAWAHLKNRGTGAPRQTWMIDNISSLWRADWFNSIGRFDPDFTYGWGVDLETCWKARKAGRSLWVDERVLIKKVTDIGYAMQRMNMTAKERRAVASANMNGIMWQKYGPRWKDIILGEGVTHGLR